MVLVGIVAFLSTAAPADAVASIQATYQHARSMTASFTQTYTDTLRNKKRVESGKLWVKADGRVRWTYEAPERKDFVFDGKTAYFYEPENAQVTVFERFADSPIAHAMGFLWGQGQLLKSFAVTACDASCPSPAAGHSMLYLTPKTPLAAVDHVVLVVEDKTSQVRRSLVFDPLGNTTEYAFLDIQFNAPIESRKFIFNVPQGVSLLRTTAEGSSSEAKTP